MEFLRSHRSLNFYEIIFPWEFIHQHLRSANSSFFGKPCLRTLLLGFFQNHDGAAEILMKPPLHFLHGPFHGEP
jgi:hypothetical protein